MKLTLLTYSNNLLDEETIERLEIFPLMIARPISLYYILYVLILPAV